jgi:hypothetical protein
MQGQAKAQNLRYLDAVVIKIKIYLIYRKTVKGFKDVLEDFKQIYSLYLKMLLIKYFGAPVIKENQIKVLCFQRCFLGIKTIESRNDLFLYLCIFYSIDATEQQYKSSLRTIRFVFL